MTRLTVSPFKEKAAAVEGKIIPITIRAIAIIPIMDPLLESNNFFVTFMI
jgi:hypothetical protein